MKRRFTQNIDRRGRLLRGATSIALLVAAAFMIEFSTPAGGIFLAFGLFVGFEAVAGWCALRSCGIKTKF